MNESLENLIFKSHLYNIIIIVPAKSRIAMDQESIMQIKIIPRIPPQRKSKNPILKHCI